VTASSMFSLSIALALGSAATALWWPQQDQKTIVPSNAERQMAGSHCFHANMGIPTVSEAVSSSPYLECQSTFLMYPPEASWEAVFRSAAR